METEKFNNNFFNLNPLPSWIYDDETLGILEVNQAAIAHYGYTREEFLTLTLKDLRPPEEIPKLMESRTVVKNIEGNIYIGIFIHKKKNGTLIKMEINGHKLVFNDRQCMLVVCQDVTKKIKQEELLLQSEQRFKALVQEGADMISIIDTEGKYSYTSPTTTSILGITPEEFEGKTIFDFIHPDDKERASGYMQRISIENKVVVEPFRLRDGKNEWRWIESVLTNMMDNPAVNGIVANSRDITDQVNAQRQLEASELFNRTVLESSPDCVKVIDTEGCLQYMNYNGLSHMEIDDFSHFKDKAWSKLWGSENEAIINASLAKALAGETSQFTAFCPTVKGTPKWWDVLVSPVSNSDEPVKQIIAVSRDITKQKEEEYRLKLLSSVITNTNDAVLITEAEPLDEPGPRIIYVNEAFTKMTGYTAAEVVGKSPRILQGPNSDRVELEKLNKALRNRESCEITTINYKKNGEEFWINFTVSPVADENGRHTHWIAIERDVTEQKQKELEKALLVKISLNFSSENDLLTSSEALCETINAYGHFDFVEIWLPNIEYNKIHLVACNSGSANAKTFYECSKEIRTFTQDEGLPGMVWGLKSTLLWKDISKVDDFVRKEAAQVAGIQHALGVPLLFNEKIVGVLVVATQGELSHLEKYVKLFTQFEDFIGSEINRKKLENDLNHLYQAIPDILCLVDFQGRFLKMNKAGYELLGYSEDEILYQTCENFVHPEDHEISINEIAQLAKGKKTFKFENRYITKSGEIIWLNWIGNSSVEEGLIYATAKNITEEKKLRELNRQSRKLAKIGSWEVDMINQTLYWSEEVHQMHETDPNSFVPDLVNGINFYREDFRALVDANVEKCIREGEPIDYEAVLVTVNKKELWVRVIGNAEMVDGKCQRLYGSFQDIHERKEAEIRLLSLADNLPGVVFQYNIYPNGTDRLKSVTKGSQEVWGFSAEEVMENNLLVWNQIAAGGDLEEVQKSISESVVSKSKWSAQWKYVLPTGELKTHLGYGSPSYLADGTVVFNSVILDVTAEAKNEELLEQVSKLAKIGSWEIDIEKNELYFSEIAHQILETDRENHRPNLETDFNFYREDFRSMAQAKLKESTEKGTSFNHEAVIVTKNKKEKWVSVFGSAEMHLGQCKKIYGSVQDITERKEAEIRLLSLSDNIPGVVYQYYIYPDGTDALKHISGAVEQLWGFTAEQVLENVNLVWDQIKAAGDFEETKASIFKSIETNSKWSTRVKYLMPTGELRTHLGIGTPVFLADGSILFNSILLDVTQEVKNEMLLRQASEMARIGSWEMDLLSQEGDKMFWSPLIKEILEVDQDYDTSLSGGLEFYTEESHERIKKALSDLIDEGVEFDEELLLITSKGDERWVRAIGKSERINGKCTKIYGSFQDIHFTKSLELHISEILRSISDAFYAVDSNWNFTYFNKESENLLNRKSENVLGKNIWKEFPAAIGTPLQEIYLRVAQTGKSESFEYFFPGNGNWYEVNAYPSSGGVSAYFKNIDGRREAAEALQQAFEEKNNILESIGDAFIALDKNWIVTYWNKEAELVLGRKREEMIGEYIWEKYADAIDSDFYRQYHKAQKTGENVSFEEYYSTLNKWFEVAVYPSEEGLSVYFKDVTLRKEADIRLIQANERFEKVTDATNDAIWDYDVLKNDLFWGRGFQTLFGYDMDETKPSFDFLVSLIHESDRERIATKVAQYMQDPKLTSWYEEYRFLRADGSFAFVIDRATFIRNSQGQVIRVIGAMTDISERKKFEHQLVELNESLQTYAKELERSNEELEQFAFITSHDLQEPLRMISSFMDQLKRKYEDQLDEKALKYIHFASDGAKRMKQIILDLLDYSRAGKPSDSLELVNLNMILSDFKQLRRKIISEKAVKISASELPTIYTYKAGITQVFHSLVDNAIKYSKAGIAPHIEIDATEQADEWTFSIKDNGIGIDPEFHDKIFTLFQRLHNRNEYDGTGIGLSIAKKHVEFLGGKIWLESSPGKGTIFYFTIEKKHLTI
ncbi:PAS domain S-box protein [Algoriphagus yeomjeoni]|uniref:histidine kinase n=1 Tax=Algoriphagus yeomjeoni TaxID=291403 RepID=A0A327P899_9BACT|nr:PAS domain S-box protein [Algoriphagus yeomjeoni]RAI87913.1 PAS domain S-box-containing protein [Algoriphagus yeomjeoni]